MKNIDRLRQSLLRYLEGRGIRSLLVSRDDMKGKAVVKFHFDLKTTPCILYGPFQDRTKEIVSIAHESGHVVIYKKMSREEARTYLCTMFAAYGIGLDKISPTGQESILMVEAGASANGFNILKEIGTSPIDLKRVTKLMAQWYGTCEALCQNDVVTKVRERILKDHDTAFLFS